MITWPALHPLLDRSGWARKGEASIRALWDGLGARLVEIDERGRFELPLGRPLAGPDGRPVVDFDVDRHALLGTSSDGDVAWFATRAEGLQLERATDLREAALDPLALEVVEAALAVLAWHERGGAAGVPCERCGAPTKWAPGGFSRRCTQCTAEVFPRTDPAMIVAVVDASDRLLLAHQASWAPGRVSVLAGFLEAGESAERAVVREVAEEVGLTISGARYLASQPWPFPRSLMLGFVARGDGQPVVDADEIAWARWFTRAELEAALDNGELSGPSPNSIAAKLIGLWREGRLPSPEAD